MASRDEQSEVELWEWDGSVESPKSLAPAAAAQTHSESNDGNEERPSGENRGEDAKGEVRAKGEEKGDEGESSGDGVEHEGVCRWERERLGDEMKRDDMRQNGQFRRRGRSNRGHRSSQVKP